MMDQFLGNYYGNISPSSMEDQEKTAADAQVALFQKLASDNGIDLDQLSEEQIHHLWDGTFGKQASEDGGEEGEGEGEETKESDGEVHNEHNDRLHEKKEEAKKEHEEKKEAGAKFAEADFLGKVMAHSMVAELRKISSEADEDGESKEAAMPKQLADALGKGKGVAQRVGAAAGRAADKAKEVTGIKSLQHAHGHNKAEKARRIFGDAEGAAIAKSNRDRALKSGGKRLGATAAAAGAAAGAAVAAKKKESSAIDELAFDAAVKIAEAGGWDGEECANRISALATLDMIPESEKVASVQDLDTAVQVRGLELLETAGYPVNWEAIGL